MTAVDAVEVMVAATIIIIIIITARVKHQSETHRVLTPEKHYFRVQHHKI